MAIDPRAGVPLAPNPVSRPWIDAASSRPIDSNDAIRRRADEATLRRWAIEQVMTHCPSVLTTEEVIEAAKAIEAYVKGSE